MGRGAGRAEGPRPHVGAGPRNPGTSRRIFDDAAMGRGQAPRGTQSRERGPRGHVTVPVGTDSSGRSRPVASSDGCFSLPPPLGRGAEADRPPPPEKTGNVL